MRRCIFCGRTDNEFDGRNQWTVEHIIPECLGNSTLILRNVCKPVSYTHLTLPTT